MPHSHWRNHTYATEYSYTVYRVYCSHIVIDAPLNQLRWCWQLLNRNSGDRARQLILRDLRNPKVVQVAFHLHHNWHKDYQPFCMTIINFITITCSSPFSWLSERVEPGRVFWDPDPPLRPGHQHGDPGGKRRSLHAIRRGGSILPSSMMNHHLGQG